MPTAQRLPRIRAPAWPRAHAPLAQIPRRGHQEGKAAEKIASGHGEGSADVAESVRKSEAESDLHERAGRVDEHGEARTALRIEERRDVDAE